MEFTDNDKTMIENEIRELRRQVAVAEDTRKIMKLGLDEWQAGRMAQYLNGAADVDSFLAEVQRLFSKKERRLAEALKASAASRGKEYRSSTVVTQEAFDKMSYLERVQLFDRDPETYERLLGR